MSYVYASSPKVAVYVVALNCGGSVKEPNEHRGSDSLVKDAE